MESSKYLSHKSPNFRNQHQNYSLKGQQNGNGGAGSVNGMLQPKKRKSTLNSSFNGNNQNDSLTFSKLLKLNNEVKQYNHNNDRKKNLETEAMPVLLPQQTNLPSAGTSNSNSKDDLESQRRALPITGCEKRLMEELRANDTLLLMGETGSGKTTQLPQFLLKAGYGHNDKQIAITQPRRVAAITVAKRVAQEQNCQLGGLVGYTVRFDDCTSKETKIRFMTDGFLLREAIKDRLLLNYSVIMLDEAHERTVSTDVLFAILKKAQSQRNKMKKVHTLKLIIASATMDIDHFSKYFGVRGIFLEGRTHTVRVMHVKEEQSDYQHAALVTLFELHRNTPIDHDILVFLTGQEEIELMSQKIKLIVKVNQNKMAPIRVFPLYAQLPQNRQLDCFVSTRPNVRKVVLATNLAETSITIPGIRCVIDSGYVKRRIYNPITGLDILRIVRISEAQAWQRCGRAGRDATGVCYRIYTKEQMNAFEKLEKPEILRSNIAATVLQLLMMSIDCRYFDFMDKPSTDAITDAYVKLYYLGAIKKFKSDKVPELTPLGKQMVLFPLEPQYSKLLISASTFGCVEEMLDLVAVISGQEIFLHPTEKQEQAALAHAKFHSKYGDHLTLLNVFTAFLKTEKTKLWCQDNFFNARNLTYAKEVREQLLEITKGLNLELTSCGQNIDQLRKCLLTGLFDNIAELRHDKCYLTVTGKLRAKIHPSSVLHRRYHPQYLVYSEIILTERNYLRYVTEIQPEWVGEVVPNFMYLNRIKVKTNLT